MDLKEYLESEGIMKKKFAEKLDVTPVTLYAIIAKKTDIKLSLALKIEKMTGGKVKCKDLAPKTESK